MASRASLAAAADLSWASTAAWASVRRRGVDARQLVMSATTIIMTKSNAMTMRNKIKRIIIFYLFFIKKIYEFDLELFTFFSV